MAQPSQLCSLDVERPHSTAVCACCFLTPEPTRSLSLIGEQTRPWSWWVLVPPEQPEQRLRRAPPSSWARGRPCNLGKPRPLPRAGLGQAFLGRWCLRSVCSPAAMQQGAEQLPWSSDLGLHERGSSPGPGQELNRALGFPKIKLRIFTIALDIFPQRTSPLHPDKHISECPTHTCTYVLCGGDKGSGGGSWFHRSLAVAPHLCGCGRVLPGPLPPAPVGWEAGLAVAQWRPHLDRRVKIPEPRQVPGWQCKADGGW